MNGLMDFSFIGKLIEERIDEIIKLSWEEYGYVSAYKSWKLSGCTSKKLEWSCIKDYLERPSVSLKRVHNIKMGKK